MKDRCAVSFTIFNRYFDEIVRANLRTERVGVRAKAKSLESAM